MDERKYRAAVDSVKFSEGFARDTVLLMRRKAGQKAEKEKEKMNMRKIIRMPMVVAAAAVLLAATALALTVLLSPKEVASKAGDDVLAGAFDSKDAKIINQTVKSGDYKITLQGIVSGEGLAEYDKEVKADKSYIVASVAYADDREIKEMDEGKLTFSPLVSGYKPWQVNAWTLDGGYRSFVHEGVCYYIFDCSNLEIFADHTVYLAAYEGFAPSADIFSIDEKGEISFAEGFDKPNAMFTLPLDPSKADPDAAKALLDAMGASPNNAA